MGEVGRIDATLVNHMAKVFDANAYRRQGPADGLGIVRKLPVLARKSSIDSVSSVDMKLDMLTLKVDALLEMQQKVFEKLDEMSQEITDLGKDVEAIKVNQEEVVRGGASQARHKNIDAESQRRIQELYTEMSGMMTSMKQSSEKQGRKIEGLERMMSGLQGVISFLGETFKNSRLVEFVLKGRAPSRRGSVAEGGEDEDGISNSRAKQDVKVDDVKGHKDKHFKTPIGLAEIKPCHKKKHYDPDDSESDKSDDAIEQLNKENSRKSRPPMGAAGGDGAAAGLGQSRSWSVRAAVERVQAKVTPGNAPLARPGARKTKRDVSGVNGDDGDDDEEGSVTEKETDEESPVAGDSDTQSEGAVAKGPAAVNGRPTDDEAHVDIARVRKGSLVAEKAVAAAAAAVEPPPVLPSPCKDFSAKSQDKGPPSCTNSQGAEGGEDKREADTKKRATEGKDPKEDSKKSKVDDVKVAPVVTQTKELKIKSKASPGEAPSKTPSEAQKKSPSKATLGDGPSLPTGGAPSKGPSDGRSKPTGKGLRETESKDSSETQVGTVQAESEETPNSEASDDVIDDCPPPPAPFEHRMVVPQSEAVSTSYSIKQKDVLGGGRFGRVHKCVERTSGMTLAAKVIKAKGVKEKDEVNNEISIMNQLKHNNLLQLYDAYESKNDFVLIMEYIHGGELFDRIVSEDYNLTELDAIIFIRQICEGIHYMHQQYILHLDLKPENILCVNRKGNQIKIIDFGLARRYKPREKLKVHFGTPEFLAPEVVNYDYVSFPTDMWSLGVIAYMLLSGLSPFMGEDDNETLTNIVNVNWDFDDEAFENVSEEAKDFISRLLIKEKSGRMSASQCLKHNWLVNLSERAKKCKVRLKSQLLLHTYMVRRMWKKNFFAVTAANRLRKISSSTSLALEGSEK
uniref:Myosin light chain kinase 2, skeletal/cardiac muscle-like isoform X5 n=1 Tax=Petromyzon marinus TaxID=7757 RepID=A0AAJ7X062_PETMA|nr:myosin light chain kinase 2, skeletal/cardiac muscle-like isoform X5 [Petromyzon marinus]